MPMILRLNVTNTALNKDSSYTGVGVALSGLVSCSTSLSFPVVALDALLTVVASRMHKGLFSGGQRAKKLRSTSSVMVCVCRDCGSSQKSGIPIQSYGQQRRDNGRHAPSFSRGLENPTSRKGPIHQKVRRDNHLHKKSNHCVYGSMKHRAHDACCSGSTLPAPKPGGAGGGLKKEVQGTFMQRCVVSWFDY